MSIRVKDLKNQIDSKGPRPILYCPICGVEYSANAGDYFLARPDHIFICCGEPMLLVIKTTHFVEVRV